MAQFDDIFREIKQYGCYQLFFLIALQYSCISMAGNAAGSFMSLGGLRPTYICNDSALLAVNDTCTIIRQCENLTVVREFYSMYEEFEWACLDNYILPLLASLSTVGSVIGYFGGGHLADHIGRKYVVLVALTVYLVCGIGNSFVPGWKSYIVLSFIMAVAGPMMTGPAFSLAMESVGPKYRLLQSFGFQWSLGYQVLRCLLRALVNVGAQFVAVIAWLTGNWRHNLLVVNAVGLPMLIMFACLRESPRWLLQKRRYARGAAAVNWMARWNGRPTRYTAAAVERVDVGQRGEAHHRYNALHLFSSWRLASYSITQIVTGTAINVVGFTMLMNVQSLAGSPFVNVALFGLLRLWTPFFAVLMERKTLWFGRRVLFLVSQGTVCLCFVGNIVIYVCGAWWQLRALATGLALLGYAVNVSLVWVAYKQFTTELFPTVVRTIALGTFSFVSLVGTALAPQLILLRDYWLPAPYAGSALVVGLSFVLAFVFLPETKDRPLPDTLEALDPYHTVAERVELEKESLRNVD